MAEYIHLKGRKELLKREDELTALGQRSGVRNAGGQIRALLKDHSANSKIPHLILPADPAMGDFAVLLREYSVAGVPLGILFPIDQTGELTVLAPEQDRAHIALQVLTYLRNKNVFVALVSIRDADVATQSRSVNTLSRFATQTRRIKRSLPLKGTMEETLATFGPRTRRNFRYYTRKAESELDAALDTSFQISEEAFLVLNRNGSHPFPDDVGRRLYTLSQEPNRFLVAMTINGDRYVSALGGRRFGDQAIIDWQINDRALKRFSLSTVARHLYIQHEIQRGTTLLSFEGGTPHSMQSSFLEELVTDAMAVRKPFSPYFVRRMIVAIFPRGSFVSYILNDGRDTWR